MSLATPEQMRENCFALILTQAQKTRMMCREDNGLIAQHLEDILASTEKGIISKRANEQEECLKKIAGWLAGDHRIPADIEHGFSIINQVAGSGLHAEREVEREHRKASLE